MLALSTALSNQPGTEIENTARRSGTREGCDQLHLRRAGIVQAAAVLALVGLALTAHIEKRITASKLHQPVSDITLVSLLVHAPSLPLTAARYPAYRSAPVAHGSGR